MGCDIHMHIEIQVDGKWEHYAFPDIDRNYRLFAKLADVRNSFGIEPISYPKGLPEDISVVTKINADRWALDGHSFSWLSINEIMELEEWLLEEKKRVYEGKDTSSAEYFLAYDLEHSILHRTYFFGNSFTSHIRYSDTPLSKYGVEDIRFVFWFDN